MTTPLTDAEIDYARRLAAMNREVRLPEGSGFFIAMLIGSAMWAVIGIVIYFLFFN